MRQGVRGVRGDRGIRGNRWVCCDWMFRETEGLEENGDSGKTGGETVETEGSRETVGERGNRGESGVREEGIVGSEKTCPWFIGFLGF